MDIRALPAFPRLELLSRHRAERLTGNPGRSQRVLGGPRAIVAAGLPWVAVARDPCYHAIQSFRDQGTLDVFHGRNTKDARRKCPRNLTRLAARKLDLLDSVVKLEELRIPPANRLERLAGERATQFSIRINDQYRICFVWTEIGPAQVEIADYH